MFWVMTTLTMPMSSSSARARCPLLGLASHRQIAPEVCISIMHFHTTSGSARKRGRKNMLGS